MKSITSIAYKTLTALMVVMLALTAMPVTPASAADTGFLNPTVSVAGGGFTNPNNGWTSNNTYATVGGDNIQQQYSTFNIPAIPAGYVITGIEVGVEGNHSNNTSGRRSIDVELSWNNGVNWTALQNTGNFNPVPDQTIPLGSANNTWGRTWAIGDFTNANFRVRLTSDRSSGTTSIDMVQVRVTYSLPTTTTLTSDINPTTAGQTVTFLANVLPALATGTVTFRDGATPIGSGILAGGTATFSTSALTVGPHNITAVYNGDSTYGVSTSAILAQDVYGPPAFLSAANTTFTVLTAGSFQMIASGYGPQTLTFTQSGGDPLPAGVTLSPAGLLSITASATGIAGTYNFVITASNGINPDATQNFILTVNKRTNSINFNAPASSTYGATFTLTPTASSGLPVTVTVVSGSCSIAGYVVTVTGMTNCVFAANQAGNADYVAAAEVGDMVTINKAAATVTVDPSPHTADAPSQSFYSHPMTFTVTVTSPGATPTGTVTLTGGTPAQNITVPLVAGVAQITTSNLNVLYSAGTGVYLAHGGNALACFLAGVACPPLVITYNGDANFNTDTEQVSHIVYPAPTQVNVTSDINPSAVGQPVIFTVTVSTTPPGTGTPPGTVTLWDGTTQIGGPIPLNASGQAIFPSNSTLNYGAHNITARFTSTSSNYASNSTSNTYVQNVRRATTTTLASDNNPSFYGENVIFTATVASLTPGAINGTVRFYDGATLLGTGTVNLVGVNYEATFTTNALLVGTHPITAVYVPEVGSIFATSTSAVLNQVVGKATLTVRADNQSITYGDADPSPFTYTITGFLFIDTIATIDILPTCTVLTNPHVNVGTYPITCSGANDNYYTFNYPTPPVPPPAPTFGWLTVNQKPLTITANDQTKVYFTIFTFLGTEFSTTGLLAGDTVDSVTLTSAGALQNATVAGSPYPIVPSNAIGTGLGNYAITYVNGAMRVVPSGTNVLTITANDQTKTYGDTFTFAGNEFTVTGLLGSDNVTSVTFTSTGTPPATNSAAVVGSYTITPSAAVGPGLGNYTIVYIPGPMVVTRRTLTFNPNNQIKTYGDLFTAYTGAFSPINGVQNSDNITPVYSSAGAAATATVAGSPYPITVTLNDPDGKLGNYNVPVNLPTATLTVTPRALTITADNQTKSYGTLFTFAGTEFTTGANQLVNGDTVNSVTLTSAGAPAAATVALSPYPIVPNAAVGTGLSNYTIAYSPAGRLTITKPDLIVTSNSQTKTYGDVFPVANFTGSIVGLLAGDVITASYASNGAAANAILGGYPITITLSDLNGRLANYNLIQTEGTLTVVRRELSVAAVAQTKIYGDPVVLTGVMTGSLLASDGITFTYSSPGSAPTAPVGSYTIAITLNDPNGRIGNYNYSLTPAILTVTPRTLTVTSDNKNKQYGTWFFAFTGGFGVGDIQNGDIITANYASDGSLPSAAVGPYPITITLNDPTGKLGNYTVILNEGLLTVGSSMLTVSADNKTITYGDADPTFTFTYFGFAAGDTPAVLTTLPTCTVTGPHTNAGTYLNQIVCSGGVDDAYAFTYVPGTLTVLPRALVVTPADRIKTYGSAMTSIDFSGIITGIQNTEAITATYDSPTGGPATATVAGSPYDITATLNAAPGVLDNYAVTLNTGRLTVIQRGLTVTPADKIKVYGDGVVLSGTITGIQNGDLITATYASLGADPTATVALSPYTITATLNAPAGVLANYSITYAVGSLTVTQRPLVVTPFNQTKVFGTLFTAYTGNVTGIMAFDNITVTYDSPGAIVTAPVGTYLITPTLVDPDGKLPNYNVTLNTGTLSVGLSILTVTAENKVITYGDLDPAFTFTYSGFMPGDTAAMLDTPPTCQVSVPHNNVNAFPIVCSGGIDNNYVFSYIPGLLTVTPRTLIVTPANQTKLYGDAITIFSGTIIGIQGGDNITANYASAGAVATATVAGSPYPITATLNDPGVRLGNYTVTLNAGSLTVNQRPLTVTPNPASKIYGSVLTALDFTGTIVGIQNSEAITAAYASTGSAATALVAGSPYPITATLAPAGILANYAVTSNTGALTVTQRDLVVQPADKTKVFGTGFSAFTGSLVGIQNGDTITATYDSTGAPAAMAVGAYPITTTLVDPTNKLPNYNFSIGTATLTVTLANQTITITTPAPGNAANGSTFIVAATASSGLPVTYGATGACSNAGDTFTIINPTGNCVVHYTQAGNANFTAAPEMTQNVTALPNGQTITVTTSAPPVSSFGGRFDVAATASSGLTVSITASGVCTIVDHGNGTATIIIVASNGTCIIHYNQAGNDSYASAPQITESTTVDSTAPTVTVNQEAAQLDPTNISPINFTVVFSEPVTGFANTDVTIEGTAGATTAVVTEVVPNDGTTYNVAISGMTADGTVVVSIPAGAATDVAGNESFASSTKDNTVTYFDGIGPNVQVINTSPETTDHVLGNSEIVTFDITRFTVKFNQDVYNPPGDSEADDVTNPNNYMLIRDLGDTAGLQTVTCSGGAVVPADTNIAIGTVTYDSATYTATFTINGGLPLSNGDYHLFVCGTTSIVDPLNNDLALVGSSGLPNTDFRRTFMVNIADNGGGNNNGGNKGTTKSPLTTSGMMIPVTGFNPDKVTILPIQPADKAYKSLDNIRIEIPTLGINFPIVGVLFTKDKWDLTWLQNSVGYLDGSAYPTYSGNTVLTAHVLGADNSPGPFSDIKGMQLGDRIYIHAYGEIYVYQVQENKKILPSNISTVFKHEDYNWVTLVTCENYNSKTRLYTYRRIVRAVLISVVPEK